jgi:branched-chain amino acid transport system substrate-binding protein
MKQRYSRTKPASALLAAITITAAFAGQANAACELKLGVVGPLSGPAAQWGLGLRHGVELVAAEANETGGLPVGKEKCKVTVVAIDTKYSAEGAAAAGNQLAGQGVKFIIGPVGSPEVTGIKPIGNRNGMLMMVNSYAKDAIGPQWPLAFHQGPGPSGWADPIIKIAKAKFNMKKVVIIAPNDQGGTDTASVDADAYKKNGIETSEEYYQRGTTNFAPIVTRALASKPDAIELASSPPGDSGTMVKQLRQAGFKGPIGHLGGPSTEEIARVAGGYEVLDNFYWFEPVVVDDKTRVMTERYKKLLNATPTENTFFYQWAAAARMMTKAISKAGTITDTKKVAEALRGLPVEDEGIGKGLWIGKEFFGINQELSFPFGVGLVLNGKLQPIQKLEAATGK